jgi:methionyl-tRNA formyltransferase
MRLLLLADNNTGLEIARWLISNFCDDLALLVTTVDNEITTVARQANVPTITFESSQQIVDFSASENLSFDLGVLAWWPKIICQPLLALPRRGFINTHPSFLPHNRGKHYNFWSIVEQAPFGVSLHMIDEGVDTGDIVSQLPIPYTWEDTGGSLYRKAIDAILQLFRDTYPKIRTLNFAQHPQDLSAGSAHFASELDTASEIILDTTYRARDLLNLIRARTFQGYPACTFSDGSDTFEVRIEIKRKSR